VQRGTWCPYCKSFIKEAIVREILQKLFNKPFPKSRPSWLKYNGRQLELDGYNDEIKLAFEHNGMQHYHYVGRFKNDPAQIARRDEAKKILCQKNGVTLVVIPEIDRVVKYDQLLPFLIDRLPNYAINVSAIPEINQINLYAKSDKLFEIRAIAEHKNGEWLSPSYLGSKIRLVFKCKKGHIWKALPYDIAIGKWCKRCASIEAMEKKKPSIEAIQKYAAQKGGRCLSEHYVSMKSKLLFECESGHVWSANFNNIKFGGTWCPECYKKGFDNGAFENN
jgi:thiol-disulfide isomerase/thioredoxin